MLSGSIRTPIKKMKPMIYTACQNGWIVTHRQKTEHSFESSCSLSQTIRRKVQTLALAGK